MRMPSSDLELSEVNCRVSVFESDMKVYGFLSYLLPFAEIYIKFLDI